MFLGLIVCISVEYLATQITSFRIDFRSIVLMLLHDHDLVNFANSFYRIRVFSNIVTVI